MCSCRTDIAHETRRQLSHRPRTPLIFVCANFPWPLHQGVKLRLYHIVQALATTYDVHLIALTDSGLDILNESGLAAVCGSVHLIPLSSARFKQDGAFPIWNPRISARIDQLVFDRLPSMVRGYHSNDCVSALIALRDHLGAVAVWADTASCAEMALEAGFDRILVDYDDIESEQSARSLQVLPWRPGRVLAMLDVIKTRRYERAMARRFNTIVIARPEDGSHFGPDASRIRVVPNGVLLTDVVNSPSSPNTLLFVGSFGWHPNNEAVEWMTETVMPLILATRPGVRFVAVGQRGSPEWAHRMRTLGAEVHESVGSVRPYYADATVVVAPLRRGSGTKLKVLEAMMIGRPIVATPVAMEGIEAKHDDAVLIADSPADFATAAIRLLDDAMLRDRISIRARAIAESLYSWETIRPAILAAIGSIAPTAGTTRS